MADMVKAKLFVLVSTEKRLIELWVDQDETNMKVIEVARLEYSTFSSKGQQNISLDSLKYQYFNNNIRSNKVPGPKIGLGRLMAWWAMAHR